MLRWSIPAEATWRRKSNPPCTSTSQPITMEKFKGASWTHHNHNQKQKVTDAPLPMLSWFSPFHQPRDHPTRWYCLRSEWVSHPNNPINKILFHRHTCRPTDLHSASLSCISNAILHCVKLTVESSRHSVYGLLCYGHLFLFTMHSATIASQFSILLQTEISGDLSFHCHLHLWYLLPGDLTCPYFWSLLMRHLVHDVFHQLFI